MKITKAIEELETIRRIHGDDIELVAIDRVNEDHPFTRQFIGFWCPATADSVAVNYCVDIGYDHECVVELKFK